MKEEYKELAKGRWIISAACFIVIIAGMREAQDIIVPFLLSLFVAIICTPFLTWLRKRKVPNTLSVIIILLGIIVVGLLFATIIGTSVSTFSEKLPEYQANLTKKMEELFIWLSSIGIHISDTKIKELLNPGSVMNMAARTLTSLSTILSNTFIIVLTIVFILFEAGGFPAKLTKALGKSNKSIAHFGKIGDSINRYMAIKTIFSFSTGCLTAIWLTFLGVDYALLWGVVAFLLNFIPNIGSIIAAIPAILMALIQLGLWPATLTTLGYLAINITAGTIIEPKVMGKGLGLSTLIVFLSLIFWGWVLGPVGMILSVPLTVILKIALENSEDKRWIAVLLGSS